MWRFPGAAAKIPRQIASEIRMDAIVILMGIYFRVAEFWSVPSESQDVLRKLSDAAGDSAVAGEAVSAGDAVASAILCWRCFFAGEGDSAGNSGGTAC